MLFTKKKNKIKITTINLNQKRDSNQFKIKRGLRKRLSINKQKDIVNHDNPELVAVIDFNISNNDGGEFSRFEHKVDYVMANKHAFSKVLVKIHSPGGAVTEYANLSAKLETIRNAGIEVWTFVDKVAASGGYLMAVVGHKLHANTMSIVGSVGVVAEFPNFSGLLGKNGVEYNSYTSGKSKRSVGMFTRNTEDGEKIMNDTLELIHDQFIAVVNKYRTIDVKHLDGSIMMGDKALANGLIDEIKDSSQAINELIDNGDTVIHIIAKGEVSSSDDYRTKTSLSSMFADIIKTIFDEIETRIKNNNVIR